MEPPGDHNLQDYLTAWLEGELDRAQVENLRRYICENPAALDAVERDVRIKSEARRVLRADIPGAPAALRERVSALAAPPSRPSRVWMSWAALIVLGLGMGLLVGRHGHGPTVQQDAGTADVIPAGMVTFVSRTHATCARLDERLHAGGYPQDAGALAADVARDLRSDRPFPDLSALDFHYVGAGPCASPREGIIHLLYKSSLPHSVAAISLFVERWAGDYPIAAGRVYSVSPGRDVFPMLAWRTETVVYFLLADDEATVEGARRIISTDAAKPGP